jgi:hypothetical protein
LEKTPIPGKKISEADADALIAAAQAILDQLL